MSVENVFHADIIPQMQGGCMARSGGAVARTPTVGVSNSGFQAVLSTKNSEEPKNPKSHFLCYGRIIVEIKAVAELTAEHRAQLMNYLRLTRMKMGLLVNFASYPKATVEQWVL